MGFNAKLFEVVLYPESFDMDSLDNILDNNVKDYAYITHDKDNKKVHVHVAIRTPDTRNSDYVAKWFNVSSNAVNRVQGRWSDMLKYLTHSNAKDKFQYNEDEVKSNFDWKQDIVKGDKNNRLDEIIEQISSGLIREYNYFNYISDKEYVKYKRQIETAFNYRKDKIKGENRQMECLFITGDSQTGKTTYAKLVCDEKNYSYYVSSGSNDVLDDYKGQDVIILDDLRPSCMGLSDLLKMLDNNTASTVKSRYKNKVLECKMIIITTVLPIDTFFSNVFTEEKETIVQLKRRCKTYIKMFTETMNIFIYDDVLRDYDEPFTAKNPIHSMFTARRLSREEQLKKACSILGNLQIDDKDNKMELIAENVEKTPFKQEYLDLSDNLL